MGGGGTGSQMLFKLDREPSIKSNSGIKGFTFDCGRGGDSQAYEDPIT